MKLHRPYIPIGVRLVVAKEMYYARFGRMPMMYPSATLTLERVLGSLFGIDTVHLDHHPALTNRKYNPRTKTYTPRANDPRYLIYRPKHDHDIKTRLRGDGAQLSDLGLRRKFKRIEKRKQKKKWKPRKPKVLR